MSHSVHPEVTLPSAPFVEPDGNVILRSSDGQNFHVWKSILAVASTHFRSRFNHKDSASPSEFEFADSDFEECNICEKSPRDLGKDKENRGGSVVNQKDVVHMSEDSTALDVFLRLCYPVVPPIISDAHLAEKVLDAGFKYNAPFVIQEARRALVAPGILADPEKALRAFAVAWSFKLKEEVFLVAKAALALNIEDAFIPELNKLPTTAYFELLKYRREVAKKLDKALKESLSPDTSNSDAKALRCHCDWCGDPTEFWFCYVNKAREYIREIPHHPKLLSKELIVMALDDEEVFCSRCKNNAWPTVIASIIKLEALLDLAANEPTHKVFSFGTRNMVDSTIRSPGMSWADAQAKLAPQTSSG